ncbi:hypothetical protein TNCV_680601 [Trichonephila clavipes]|nr:hypothetical protein TNCV_680601 [Trichonephila clavipes]
MFAAMVKGRFCLKNVSATEWLRGTTERKYRLTRRIAVTHHIADAAEFRDAVCSRVTPQTITNRLLQE